MSANPAAPGGRLGGAVTRHGRRRGLWFDPAPWTLAVATLVWVLTLWRQKPCQTHLADQPVDPMLRLCYSDIPVVWQSTWLGQGRLPYAAFDLEYPVLTGAFMMLGRGIVRLLGLPVAPGTAGQRILDGANMFLQVNAVLLFGCLLLLVGCQLLLGRESARGVADRIDGRVRSWDAMYVAAAPALFTAGLINFDLFGVALTSLAMLLWAVKRPTASGVVLGLAVSARFYPLLLLLALLLLCLRAGRMRAWTRTAVATLGVWSLLNLPVLVLAPHGWSAYFRAWASRGADMGSLWFVLGEMGLKLPLVTPLSVLLMLAWLVGVTQLVFRAPRRPRVAQVMLLLVLGFLVLNKVYSPQYVLWLLPLVAMARPVRFDWALWSGAEALYWWAVWGHLGGQIAPGDGSPDALYWAAIVFRVGIQLWLAAQVVHDITHPWDDPVRGPFVDDPAGGVLDHAPDIAFDRAGPVEAGIGLLNDEVSDRA